VEKTEIVLMMEDNGHAVVNSGGKSLSVIDVNGIIE